jgi:hypothetical protein
MAKRHPRRDTAGLLFYLAAWGVSSVLTGVLLGRYLKEVSADDPIGEPIEAPALKIARSRQSAS